MPTPSETLWEIEPHTRAKHAILQRYLGAWFGIMGRSNQRIIYLDGFCGPGRYRGGEDGSPIIALKIAQDHHAKHNLHEVTFVFVEDRQDRVEHLRNVISNFTVPATFHVKLIHNQFENTLCDILDSLNASGAMIAPTFAFIDPFGFKGAPYTLVRRLLKNPKTEVFINIMADSINRFIDHPEPQITNHIVDLFGTPQVLQILNAGGNGIQQLRELYQSQLKQCAKFVRYFEMRDENNRVIYYLFFATNNRVGHIKMKEAFWKVDSSTGYIFSDATDPNQLVLFETDPSIEVAKTLVEKFRGKTVGIHCVKQFIEEATPYTESHMKKTLRYLEDAEKLCVEPCKQDGSKRIKSSFPDNVIVTFPIIS